MAYFTCLLYLLAHSSHMNYEDGMAQIIQLFDSIAYNIYWYRLVSGNNLVFTIMTIIMIMSPAPRWSLLLSPLLSLSYSPLSLSLSLSLSLFFCLSIPLHLSHCLTLTPHLLLTLQVKPTFLSLNIIHGTLYHVLMSCRVRCAPKHAKCLITC